jgi:hypothetical protein
MTMFFCLLLNLMTLDTPLTQSPLPPAHFFFKNIYFIFFIKTK